jgi:hypothetical protein
MSKKKPAAAKSRAATLKQSRPSVTRKAPRTAVTIHGAKPGLVAAVNANLAMSAQPNPRPPPASGPDASAAASRVDTPKAQPDAAPRPAATPEQQLLANAFDALAAAEADEERTAAALKTARELLTKAEAEADAARGALHAADNEVARTRTELARTLRLLRPGQMVEHNGCRYYGHRQLRVFDFAGKPILPRSVLELDTF